MAKLTGFVGTASGRIGNMVYSKGKNGATIARAYQPQVANPKSGQQVSTRARFTLATKMAAAMRTSGQLLLKSMGYSPKDRGELVKRLMDVIGIEGSELQPTAASVTVASTELRPYGDIELSRPTVVFKDDETVEVTLNLPSTYTTIPGTVVSLVATITQMSPNYSLGNNIASSQKVAINTGNALPSTLTITISASTIESIAQGVVTAYAIMAVPSTGSVISKTQSLNPKWDNIVSQSGKTLLNIDYLTSTDFLYSNLAVASQSFQL